MIGKRLEKTVEDHQTETRTESPQIHTTSIEPNLKPGSTNNQLFFFTGANPSFIRALKARVNEDTEYEDQIVRWKSEYGAAIVDLDWPANNMFVLPVAFSKYHKEMLAHCKELMEYQTGYMAIHPSHNKLITALRTAVENGVKGYDYPEVYELLEKYGYTIHIPLRGEGDNHLDSVYWRNNQTGQTEKHEIRHIFVMTGADPNTRWLDGCLALDDKGFIKTGPDISPENLTDTLWSLTRQPYLLETSLPGVFAVGDVRGGSIKRVASAVGEGSIAISFVHKVLQE